MARPNRGPRLLANEAGVYEVHWTEGGRSKRVSTRTADAAEAADFFATWKRGLEREKAQASASTVRGLLDAYFAEHVHKKVVGQGTAEIAKKHLLAHFADMDPAEIHPSDVRRYARRRELAEIGRPAKGPTIRRELGVLVAALNHAVAEKRLKRTDLPSIPLPEPSQPREVWLTEAEVARLAAKAAEVRPDGRLSRIERFVALAYYTAARKRALEELDWSQVDWDTGMIHLEKPGRRRTKKRRPSVPMHPKLRELMERAFVERESKWVLDNSGNVRKAFASLVKAAGLPAEVTPHVMRHTAATHMLRRKVPLWQVAGILGDTEATVQKTYGKHVPEALKEAVEALL
jgi:integrase